MELYLAFTIGLIGSLHCLSMCGPLLLFFNFGNKTTKGKWMAFLYHFFRVTAYVILGSAVGGLMGSLEFFGIARWISVSLGVLFLLMGLRQLFLKKSNLASESSPFFQKIYGKVMRNTSGYGKIILAGFLNGLLPCGLVYVALSGAVLTHHFSQGALYMLVFGAGTFPAMYLVSLFSQWIKNKIAKVRIQWLIPSVYVLTGALLMLRGMNLGIPYLSPKMEKQKISCCHAK